MLMAGMADEETAGRAILSNSYSENTTKAATPKAVKTALDAAKEYCDNKGNGASIFSTTSEVEYGYKIGKDDNGAYVSDESYNCTSAAQTIDSAHKLIFLPESMTGGWISFYSNSGTTGYLSSVDIAAACTVQIPAAAKYFRLTKLASNSDTFGWVCITPSASSGSDSSSADLSAYRTSAAQDAIDNAQDAEIDTKAEKDHNHDSTYVKRNDLLDKTWPVDSIYLSMTNTNPGELFGGVWDAFGQGRMLVGVNTSDTDFNASGKTGGTKVENNVLLAHTHGATLTGATQSNGAHTHKMYLTYEQDTGSGSNRNRVIPAPNGSYTTTAYTTESAGAHTHSVTLQGTTDSTGTGTTGSTHNNMSPYITVYMWRRIA